jgi:hypothetical protein
VPQWHTRIDRLTPERLAAAGGLTLEEMNMTNSQKYHSDQVTYTVPGNGRTVSAFAARRFERRFGRGSWAEYLWAHQ